MTTEDTDTVRQNESVVGLGIFGVESPADISGTEVGKVGWLLTGQKRKLRRQERRRRSDQCKILQVKSCFLPQG